VTGATGFVGSHLAERLVSTGARVRCLLRKTSSQRYLPATGLDFAYGDLASGAGVDEALEGAGVVFHVAGVTKARSESEYFAGNLSGTVNLLRACERMATPPRRIVHVSSLAAVGPSPDGTPLTEDAPPRPLTWYGRSKLAAEAAVGASRLASRTVIVRPPVVYGPRDTDVFEVFRSIAQGFMILIGRQEACFSYTHAGDLADALIAAAGAAEGGKTYFVANPEPVSWTAFAKVAAKAMGRDDVRFVHAPLVAAYAAGWCAEAASRLRGRPGILSRQKIVEARCPYWTCNSSRARTELALGPPRPLATGVAETLRWYKDEGWLKF
jgi:dihydroflavonol-4-reductase